MPRTVVRESKGSRATPLLVEPYCWHKLRRARLGLGVSSTTMLRDEAWHYLYLDLVQKMKREDLLRVLKLLDEADAEEVLRTYDNIVGYLLLAYIAKKRLQTASKVHTKVQAVLEGLIDRGYLEGLVDISLLPELFFACALNDEEICTNKLKALGNPLAELYLALLYAVKEDYEKLVHILRKTLTDEKIHRFISVSAEGSSLFLVALSKADRRVIDLARESQHLAEELITYIERSIKTIEEYVRTSITLTGPKIEQHMFYKIMLALELAETDKCIIAPKPIREEIRRVIIDSIRGYKPVPEELYRKTVDALKVCALSIELKKEVLGQIVVKDVVPAVISTIIAPLLGYWISPPPATLALVAVITSTLFIVFDIVGGKKVREVLRELEGKS